MKKRVVVSGVIAFFFGGGREKVGRDFCLPPSVEERLERGLVSYPFGGICGPVFPRKTETGSRTRDVGFCVCRVHTTFVCWKGAFLNHPTHRNTLSLTKERTHAPYRAFRALAGNRGR